MGGNKRRAKGRISSAQAAREFRRMYRERQHTRIWANLLIALCVALLCGIAISWLTFSVVRLSGDGMSNGLIGGDYVLCHHSSPLSVANDIEAQRGMIILTEVVDETGRHDIMRRVIATAGDRVYVTMNGSVSVNGVWIDEPYATYRNIDPSSDPGSGLIPNPFAVENGNNGDEPDVDAAWIETEFPLVVPEGRIFVLADDRNTFSDSRSAAIGLIEARDVTAIADAVIWPAYRAQLLRNADDIPILDFIVDLIRNAKTAVDHIG